MKKNIGVWIDHETATIVSIKEGGEDTQVVKAHGASARSGLADDRRQRSETGHLDTYYDEVIAGIGVADAILLIGPGEAKGELRKRLQEHAKVDESSITAEPADRLTEPQIVAKIRDHFAPPHASAA